MSVTVIMSGFKRPYSTLEQYNAIKNQTVQNINIMFWINQSNDNIIFPREVIDNCESTNSNANYGVWGRFALALNAKTDFVCIIDDDTIPGNRWIENCLKTYQNHQGVLTTRGVIANREKETEYPGPGSYEAFGWCNPNENTVAVDIGCHCWFFHKDILRGFWANAPHILPMNYGEDMHLSYVAQKYFGLGTYVPPHPKDDLSLWGSQPKTGKEYGEDSVAISWNYQANMGMRDYWNYLLSNGFQTRNMQNDTK